MPTFVWRPLKIQMFDGQTFMFEPTWIQTTVSQLASVRGCRRKLNTGVAKTSISRFRSVGTYFSGELPQASTVLLFGSYSGQIIPRTNLLTRRRK